MSLGSPERSPQGLLYAGGAFILWGLAPLYFKLVSDVGALEVLSHRVLWSVVILSVVVLLGSRWKRLRMVSAKTITMLFLSALCISANWFVFIWAVAQNRVLETSLGYFINPLLNVLLGFIFLSERLNVWQALAVFLAVLGVMNQVLMVGYLPWVALVLATSFGLYGLLRKLIAIDAINGLFLETCMMLPFALACLFWMKQNESLSFFHTGYVKDVILICAGLVTTLPLLLFVAGAQRLSLTVVGLVQYLAPTMTFVLAVFVFDEAFSARQLVTFGFIWAGLIVFSLSSRIRGRPAA